ncbi:MAG: hypothetical protein GF355_09090 [Candidatus Eisenbacteria bacterium]|nr:hypothetical protein [Candidatus Eisenbacteria bacterium]
MKARIVHALRPVDARPARSRFGVLGLAFFCVIITASVGGRAAVLLVPDEYPTIQSAIDGATDGDVIQVAGGIYVEQLDVGKSLSIEGAGAAATTVQAPDILQEKLTIGSVSYRPVIYIHGGAEVALRDLVVDGAGLGAANAHFVGIAVEDAGAVVNDAAVSGIHDSPYSESANGTAVLAVADGGAVRQLVFEDAVVAGYQRAGFDLSGSDLTARITDTVIHGPGASSAGAPVGILAGGGALVEIRDDIVRNNLSGCADCGPDLLGQIQADGIRLEGADPGSVVRDSYFIQNDVGVRLTGAYGLVDDFFLDNRYAGIILEGGAHVISGSNIQGDHRVGILVHGREAGDTVELFDLCLNGPGGAVENESIIGLWAVGDIGPLEVWARNCTVSQWSLGLKPEGETTELHVTETSITSNAVAGYDNREGGPAQDAGVNWWGASNGPAPQGSGDLILGEGVLFDPVLVEEYDIGAACGLQPRTVPAGIDGTAQSVPAVELEVSPNPFRETAEFAFRLGAPAQVDLRVYDVRGRLVRELVSSELPAGEHRYVWDGRRADGREVGPGVYLSTLRRGADAQARKILRFE